MRSTARRIRQVVRRAWPQPTIQEKFAHYDIGRATYGNPRIRSWGEGAQLRVGAYTAIADDVQIFLGGEHRIEWATNFPLAIRHRSVSGVVGQSTTKGDVIIGNDVWVGRNATIMSGVEVGDGAVVAACAVVVRNVEPYTIVGGNPASTIRRRFDDRTIERLLALAWWDWDDEMIDRFAPLMLSDEVGAFLDAAETQLGSS